MGGIQDRMAEVRDCGVKFGCRGAVEGSKVIASYVSVLFEQVNKFCIHGSFFDTDISYQTCLQPSLTVHIHHVWKQSMDNYNHGIQLDTT